MTGVLVKRENMHAQPQPIFLFDGMVVGEFTNGYPSTVGDFIYMPYRGPGHLQMQEKLRESHEVTCSFKKGTKIFTLTIIACPKYGVLTASDMKEEE